MNNFTVKIYDDKGLKWVDYSHKSVFSPKNANLLDEQLDEAYLTIKRIKESYFKPTSLVILEYIVNPKAKYTEDYFNREIKGKAETEVISTYDVDSHTVKETKKVIFMVASDNAIEQPVGSGLYNHEIYLIEATKITEGYIGESITFTNSLGSGYSTETKTSVVSHNVTSVGVSSGTYDLTWTSSFFTSNIQPKNIPYEFFDVDYVAKNEKNCPSLGADNPPFDFSKSSEKEFKYLRDADGNDVEFIDGKPQLTEGTYTLQYYFKVVETYVPDTWTSRVTLTYIFNVLENYLPLKKWTIKDVIERCFDLIEPLRDSDAIKGIPRFKLKTETAQKLDKIISPEFTFTKMNLREQLKQIGGFIHGEPRIISVEIDENGKKFYTIDFDFYGGNEYSNISKRRYVSATFKTDINEYCTALDSSADNLVSQLNWAQGVVVEPFTSSYAISKYYGRSLRSENTSIRLGENNDAFIPTTLPIYSLGGKMKVYCTLIPTSSGDVLKGRWDITPYIFEKTAYDNLSSYEGVYPYCKAYALYYEIGQPNIKGLFHKNPHAASSIFEQYSIINILEAVTGKNIKSSFDDNYDVKYYDLQFQVEYLPVFSQRVKTNKALVEPGEKRELAYNQSANLIETQYYGECLKGVVARMGNVEKTYTYNLAFLSQIPKVGTKFDDDYYISTVSTELLPTYIKCTVALSKDFNRLSQYVGISSEKRMWEISERQTQRRDSIFTEYLLVDEKPIEIDESSIWNYGDGVAEIILNTFKTITSPSGGPAPVSAMRIVTFDKKRKELKKVTLPVVSTSFGNSMTFSAQFKDNYSAGNANKYVKVGSSVKGMYSFPVSYTDYYGRFYYLAFSLLAGTSIKAFVNETDDDEINTMRAYPAVDLGFGPYTGAFPVSTLEYDTIKPTDRLFKYRKDNKEIPNITYELSAVTENKDIIIGTALMKNCWLVNASYISRVLRLYLTKIPKVGDLPEDYIEVENGFTVRGNELTINLEEQVEHVAWAIVTKTKITKLEVEDEDGETTVQDITEGGELVIGQNKPIIGNQKTLYFGVKSKIYN